MSSSTYKINELWITRLYHQFYLLKYLCVLFSSPSKQTLIYALSTPVESSQHTKLYISDSLKFDPYLDLTILKFLSDEFLGLFSQTYFFLSLFLKKKTKQNNERYHYRHCFLVESLSRSIILHSRYECTHFGQAMFIYVGTWPADSEFMSSFLPWIVLKFKSI